MSKSVQGEKRKSHPQVLQDFREPETFHVIYLVRRGIIHVRQPCKPVFDLQESVEAVYGTGSTVEVLGIPRRAPRVEIRLQDFRA